MPFPGRDRVPSGKDRFDAGPGGRTCKKKRGVELENQRFAGGSLETSVWEGREGFSHLSTGEHLLGSQ